MTEMSDHLFEDNQELRRTEPIIYRRKRYVERTLERFVRDQSSLIWLQRKLGLNRDFDLASMILQMELDGTAMFYHRPRVIKKTAGGTRTIISPGLELMFIQKRINCLLQRTFPPPENVFGYRGGSCLEVAERHAKWPSTLKFDIKDAFFRVGWGRVRNAIRGSSISINQPGFSSSVARWIARLCTYSPPPEVVLERLRIHSFLPQGSPTSPVCFDLACKRLDVKLTKMAHRIGGIVSRYADNYYFSMPTSRFPPKLERMIMCDVCRHGRFPVHKVRRVGQGELCKIWEYNCSGGEISNNRDFRRNLRGVLYVLRTKLDRGLPSMEAYARVKGYMGLTINLPDDLLQTYHYCEGKIKES